jgi:hypothetical protein
LEEHLTDLVSELASPNKQNYVALKTCKKIEWKGKYRSQFVLPYNSVLEAKLPECLNILSAMRKESEQCDGLTFKEVGGVIVRKKLIEAKAGKQVRKALDQSLDRIDKDAINIIVFKNSLETIKIKSLNKHMVLNRNKKQGKSFKKEKSLSDCARLCKVAIENEQVVLKTLAGKSDATVLIILISVQDINNQINA